MRSTLEIHREAITRGGQSIVVGQATTDADGNYTVTVTIPSNFANSTAVISDSCGASLNHHHRSHRRGHPARTGSSNTDSMLRIGAGLPAAGGILVLTARKRMARVSVSA